MWLCHGGCSMFTGLKAPYTCDSPAQGLDSGPVNSCFASEKQNTNSLKVFRPRDPESAKMDLKETVSQLGEGRAAKSGLIFGSCYLAPFTAFSVSWEIRPMGALSVPEPRLSRLSRTTFPGMQCSAGKTVDQKDSVTQRARGRRRTLGLHFPSVRSGSAGSPPRPSLCGSY